jgi:DNA replication protein DnaC
VIVLSERPLYRILADYFDYYHRSRPQPSINQELVRELMRGEYIDRRENVLLIGNSKTGKTHLTSGLAFTACQQGRRVPNLRVMAE